MEAKNTLRTAIRERLLRMSANDRRVESGIIRRTVEPLLVSASVVAAYMPYSDEPDIRPTLTTLLARQAIVCMPKVLGVRMHMHRIQSLDDVWKNPATGIVEPRDDDPVDEMTIDVALIPGRAFTVRGDRAGRGNGGYDRWLQGQRQSHPSMHAIGLCFDCQLVDAVPTESHDERMDIVIAPRGIFGHKTIAV